MKIRSLLLTLIILLVFFSKSFSSEIKTNAKPNIVFILADDMGTAQLGCYGSKYYQTPNIDRLAKSGMQFTNAYTAAAVCSPTRASLMTGKYPARLKVTDYIPGQTKEEDVLNIPKWQQFLPLKEITFSEVLQENGYKTALIGKWHLSKEKRPPHSLEHNPDKQGFQETFVTYKPSKNPVEQWQTPENDAHNIDTITNRSIEFLRQNKDNPFFIMLSHNAIHDPLMAKTKLIEKYKQHPLNEMPENHAVIAAMVESLDNSVGRILSTIEELGIEKNTIVIFYSDNGGKAAYCSQPPFRAGKGWLYEGGIHVPLIVKFPGKTRAGSISNQLVSSIDFFPTFIEMAGLEQAKIESLDGLSLVPLLTGKKLERNVLYWHYPHYHYGSGMKPASAIRDGDYKLIEWYEKELAGNSDFIELYNLKEDIEEQNNLAESNLELANELLNKLNKWKKEVGAQIPTLKK